ncbi:MAG: hypothetical protein ABSG69_02965 [Candidatus Acidiferrum sp.]|jgi:hypothetical protein
MKNVDSNFSKAVRWVVVAMMGAGIAAVPGVYAKPKPKAMTAPDGSKIVLVSPASLPELARQNGEAMLLHETGDGRTFLYIEQNHGARLAIFDVSDPSDIQGEGMVQLDAQGAFDFASSVGEHAVLVRFREGQREAVLDLHKVKAPAIGKVRELKSQDERVRQENGGGMMAAAIPARSTENNKTREAGYVPASNSLSAKGVVDVGEVRAEITNYDAGTTFLLTAEGLYVVRRPDVEREYAAHQDQLSNPG